MMGGGCACLGEKGSARKEGASADRALRADRRWRSDAWTQSQASAARGFWAEQKRKEEGRGNEKAVSGSWAHPGGSCKHMERGGEGLGSARNSSTWCGPGRWAAVRQASVVGGEDVRQADDDGLSITRTPAPKRRGGEAGAGCDACVPRLAKQPASPSPSVSLSSTQTSPAAAPRVSSDVPGWYRPLPRTGRRAAKSQVTALTTTGCMRDTCRYGVCGGVLGCRQPSLSTPVRF